MATITRQSHSDPAMRLGDRERRMYDFMRANPVGVLSTVDPGGDPHGTVIYYTVDEYLAIRFLTKSGTSKYENLKQHNRTMLTVFDQATQTTIQVVATAAEISDPAAINAVADTIFGTSIATSGIGMPPIVKLDAGQYTAFVLEPVQIRMATYAKREPGNYADIFESVESFSLHD